jgi:hypothetical protein
MFRCQIRNVNSQLNDKCHKVVAITRVKHYTKWVQDEDTERWMEVPAGVGFEPVLELNATKLGVEMWESWSAEERTAFLRERGFVTA